MKINNQFTYKLSAICKRINANYYCIILAFLVLTFFQIQSENNSPIESFNVDVYGQGKDIILILGLMSDGQVWSSLLNGLKVKHRIHVINIAG